ncbi:MAG: YkgJ family cysteine cluster protein [Candidatus Theseobacter exili]|nr:YkgJ family cysteine cluster protein [Candidatus Theseobacter exili]
MKEDFVCINCGECCKWEGYVHIAEEEIDQLSDYLGISIDEFTSNYTVLTNNRQGLSLKEKKNGSCIFLSKDRLCTVYTARPKQCRQFPYSWDISDSRCPAKK